jgi:hypothetical protein
VKSPHDALFQAWRDNPEPDIPSCDPQTILELEGSHDAYLWSSKDCTEQWLAYDGETEDLVR